MDTEVPPDRRRVHELVLHRPAPDTLGLGQPLYVIDRYINGEQPFGDGSHIVYVNGAMRGGDTPLGKLMHDFFCEKPDDMNYSVLANRTRSLKEDEKGVKEMKLMNQFIWEENKALKRIKGKSEDKCSKKPLKLLNGQILMDKENMTRLNSLNGLTM